VTIGITGENTVLWNGELVTLQYFLNSLLEYIMRVGPGNARIKVLAAGAARFDSLRYVLEQVNHRGVLMVALAPLEQPAQ
jgi:biopolymer transport protein ExbD